MVKTSRLLKPRSTKSPCKPIRAQSRTTIPANQTKDTGRNRLPHHENVIRLRDVSPGRKELHQVMELPMDVATHCHGAVHRLHIRLLDEDLLHLDGQRQQPRLYKGTHISITSTRFASLPPRQPFPFHLPQHLRTLTVLRARKHARACQRSREHEASKTLGAERGSQG
jgi:hypothetical protein